MTVRKFVQAYIEPYRKGQGINANTQFGVLAFNLKVHGVAPRNLPSTNPERPNQSGPWITVVEPGLGHPETQLAQGAHDRIEAYLGTVGALPQSICLYTPMSPCRGCIEWLRELPTMPLNDQATDRLGRFVYPKIWILSFDRYYVATEENRVADVLYHNQQEHTWNYPFEDRRTAKGTVEILQQYGWNIEWP